MHALQWGSWGAASSVESWGSASHRARPTAATPLAADNIACSFAAAAAVRSSSNALTCWRRRASTSCIMHNTQRVMSSSTWHCVTPASPSRTIQSTFRTPSTHTHRTLPGVSPCVDINGTLCYLLLLQQKPVLVRHSPSMTLSAHVR